MAVVDLEPVDHARTRQLVDRYEDLALGFVDSAVIAIAERLRLAAIATLDRMRLSVVRPLRCEAFALLP